MTTAALARTEARDLTPPGALTPDQIDLIKRQLMSAKRPVTDDELALFVHQCDRTGLDPFSRQIYAIFRKDRQGVERMGIQVSIDGLRLIADRSGKYAPGNSYWCGADGVWRDVWMDNTPPAAARVVVRKLVANQLIEFSVPAKWSEYKPSYDGAGLWQKMPTLMIAKCSEALALRKAFPNETSGLYTSEEMAQADAEDTIVANIKETFDAVEVDEHDRPIESAAPAPPANGAAAAPTQVDSTAPITAEEVEAMTAYLTEIGTPVSFWRMGLMTLGLDELSQLNKGQAHRLMADAKTRFASE